MVNKKTRELWAEKLLDLSHIAAGALLFGQFLSNQEFKITSAIIGILLLVIGYSLSYIFLREKK